MQKTLVAATVAALVGVAGAANAADIYSGGLKDAYVPEAGWTGFYLGLGIGGAAVNDDVSGSIYGLRNKFEGAAELNGVGGEGVFGTVQVGYDREYGRFVGGVFFDYDFADVSSTVKASDRTNSISGTSTLNNSWTIGGRLGYLVNSSTLVYALGGFTEASLTFPFVGANASDKDFTVDGYSVGGGIETKLTGNWFLRGEYRYTSLDTSTIFNGSIGRCTTAKVTDQTDVQSARLVLSYKGDLFNRDYIPLK